MSRSTISRPTVTDDNGTGTTGTVFNAAWVSDFCDRVDGMIGVSFKQKTAGYTVLNTDDYIECTSGSFTLTLHAANDATRGYNPLHIKNSGTGTITVDGNGAETIDGSTTLTLQAGDSVVLISNGTSWMVF